MIGDGEQVRAAGESCRLIRGVAEQQSRGGAEQTVTEPPPQGMAPDILKVTKLDGRRGGMEAGLKLLGARQVHLPSWVGGGGLQEGFPDT